MHPISKKRETHLGKFLAYVLRHKPDAAELTSDDQGWVSLGSLLANKNEPMALHEVQQVCAADSKGRYDLDIAGDRIRANQGHSFPVDLGLTRIKPPNFLYHGAPKRVVSAILREGLKPQSRQHVHLSGDVETAIEVGKRRDDSPTILEIDSLAMERDGLHIYKSKNGVYLADAVPAKYITILS